MEYGNLENNVMIIIKLIEMDVRIVKLIKDGLVLIQRIHHQFVFNVLNIVIIVNHLLLVSNVKMVIILIQNNVKNVREIVLLVYQKDIVYYVKCLYGNQMRVVVLYVKKLLDFIWLAINVFPNVEIIFKLRMKNVMMVI